MGEEEVIRMIDDRALHELVRDEPAWKLCIERLHDDAGLDVYDEELIHAALEDLKASLLEAIHEMSRSAFLRQIIVSAWKDHRGNGGLGHS